MKHILSLSGGKDSTYLLLELLRRGEPLDECVFFNTGWEFPQMYEHMKRLEELCAARGIAFTTLHPEKNFDYLMFEKAINFKDGSGVHFGYSWCGACGVRWGTKEKLSALDAYCKGATVLVGIAADEPGRLEKERAANKRFPLAEWGITEAECLSGCYAAGYDWNGLYTQLKRVSCKCCAAKNLDELRNMYFQMPDVWRDLQDRQRRTSRPYKGEGKSVFDLEKRFDLERERLEAGLSIRNRDFYKALKERLKEATA